MPNTIKVVINDVNRMSRTIVELETRITELNEQIATQEITISEQAEQIAQLNAQIISLNAEIAQLNVTITSLQETVSSLNAQITSLSEQVTSLQATITNLNTQISALNTGIETVNGETVADPLLYLETTKALILSALQNKGSSATSVTTFREYATEIAKLNPSGDLHTKLLLRFSENNPRDVSMYSNNITYSSGFTRSSTIKKFGSYSFKANSTSSVSLPLFEVPVWNYTIEFWIYIETMFPSNYYAFATCANSRVSTSTFYIYLFGFYNNTNTLIYRVNNTYSHDIPKSSVSLNNWHHIAYCRSNNTIRTFLDGVRIDDQTYSGLAPAVWTGTPFTFGGNSMSSGVCYADEIRISDIARYENDFTPPTEPFES